MKLYRFGVSDGETCYWINLHHRNENIDFDSLCQESISDVLSEMVSAESSDIEWLNAITDKVIDKLIAKYQFISLDTSDFVIDEYQLMERFDKRNLPSWIDDKLKSDIIKLRS